MVAPEGKTAETILAYLLGRYCQFGFYHLQMMTLELGTARCPNMSVDYTGRGEAVEFSR